MIPTRDKHTDPTSVSETTGVRPVKPANIILDLLRTYAERGTSVANIMATGAMFGFSDNRMRVGLSRLVAKQTIVNFSRGFYRLSKTADPFNTFIERWRLGESRIVPWDHRWLLVHRSRDAAPTTNAKSEWVLANHGFREAIKDCWIRPDNIALGLDELEHQLHHLGLEHEAMLASAAKLKPRWQHRWLTQVAPEQLIKRYQAMSRRLTLSLAELPNLTRAAAMKSSFQLGGQGIEMLATDPLLPAEMLDTEPRVSLTQLMLDYDLIGREIWLGAQITQDSSRG
ncbi:MAG: phenylacetic acid degradation operon negative regulatory protein [Cyclobacteriaceae bacterium]|jgi:phenylacetic acid degradation operon negative regulatory protein